MKKNRKQEEAVTTVAIVEDDKLFNEAVAIFLTKEGFQTVSGFSCREGIALIAEKPDLMLIDLTLPDGDGFSICRKARDFHNIPCIFLTARDEEIDMIEAFDSGCDDYVVKPFPMAVLKKRIEAVLRRSLGEKALFAYLGLKIDFDKKQVFFEGRPVRLTAREFRLLAFLAKNRGQVLTKEHILQELWDAEGNFVEENTLSVAINRLRKKIEPNPAEPVFIRNIFGMGYTFGE